MLPWAGRGCTGCVFGPSEHFWSAGYTGTGPAGALSRPSSMTWGWLPDSQPLPSPLPSLKRLGTGSEPLPVHVFYSKGPLEGRSPSRAQTGTGCVPLPPDSPPVVARLPVFFNAGGLMLLSVGFPPSILTCGDVEPNPGPSASFCILWAALLTTLLSFPPPP